MTSISVIIPTYNRSETLEELILELNKQTLKDIEIIVVDQNAPGFIDTVLTPSTKQMVELVHLPEPNVSTARNVGCLRASSDYLLFVDDDLVPEPDFCKRGLQILETNKNIHCLAPLVYNDIGEKATLEAAKVYFLNEEKGNLVRIRETISAALFFRKQDFINTGGFDGLLFGFAKAAEDQELFFRMKKLGMASWMDTSLAIYHNDTTPGGCDLRTVDYWIFREKCINSWVFRYRIHGERNIKLSLNDIYRLCRSAFINKEILKAGPSVILRQIRLLRLAIARTYKFLLPYAGRYRTVKEINHFSHLNTESLASKPA